MRREIERTDAYYPLIVAVCENRWQPPALETSAVNDAVAPVVESQPVGQPVERSVHGARSRPLLRTS